jgi:predicted metalloendopeptidase
MPTYKGLKNASSLISWDTFFTTLISNDYIKSNPTISFDKNQLMILDSLLTETPVKTLQEYWIIKTVRAKAFALRTESSTSDSQMLSNKYFQKSFRAPSSRDAATSTPQEICGKETSESFKHIVGRFFALSTFGGPEERNQAEDFVDVIHSTWLHDMLPKTSWIGDETKKTIIEKVFIYFISQTS